MKIVHSFWYKPFEKTSESYQHDRKYGGFISKKYFYYSCALSCLQFNKFFKEVELVTDKNGKRILIDKLNLPYSSYTTRLEEINHYHEDLWAIGKIFAYGIQTKPFIHVDNDVFIWEKFPDKILKADLVAQNFEHEVSIGVTDIMKDVYDKFDFFPNYMKKMPKNINMYNAGIMGGNDLKFYEFFSKEAFNFLNKNYSKLNELNIGALNLVIEQYLFYKIGIKSGVKVECLLENVDKDFSGLAEFLKVPDKRKYIHMVGKYKKYEIISLRLESRLRRDYPYYYYRINDLIEKKEI